MTYIKLEQAHTDDERWLGAGADAFALHVAALVYCDRQLLDGRISRAMAMRVSLAVPPERAAVAIDALKAHEFWTETEDGYVINRYEDHAFSAEQVKRSRERWRVDKERRRQHSIGDHSLCKDPKFCPALRSTVESEKESTGGRSHLYPTQLNQTRPDQTGGLGLGMGAGGDAAPGRSAGATRPVRVFAEEDYNTSNDSTPWDIVVLAHECDDKHVEVFAQPAVARDDDAAAGFSAEEMDEGYALFREIAGRVKGYFRVKALTTTPHCDECTPVPDKQDAQVADRDPFLSLIVPEPVGAAWHHKLHEAFTNTANVISNPPPASTERSA